MRSTYDCAGTSNIWNDNGVNKQTGHNICNKLGNYNCLDVVDTIGETEYNCGTWRKCDEWSAAGNGVNRLAALCGYRP
jgi:hypothetical protein